METTKHFYKSLLDKGICQKEVVVVAGRGLLWFCEVEIGALVTVLISG